MITVELPKRFSVQNRAGPIPWKRWTAASKLEPQVKKYGDEFGGTGRAGWREGEGQRNVCDFTIDDLRFFCMRLQIVNHQSPIVNRLPLRFFYAPPPHSLSPACCLPYFRSESDISAVEPIAVITRTRGRGP